MDANQVAIETLLTLQAIHQEIVIIKHCCAEQVRGASEQKYLLESVLERLYDATLCDAGTEPGPEPEAEHEHDETMLLQPLPVQPAPSTPPSYGECSVVEVTAPATTPEPAEAPQQVEVIRTIDEDDDDDGNDSDSEDDDDGDDDNSGDVTKEVVMDEVKESSREESPPSPPAPAESPVFGAITRIIKSIFPRTERVRAQHSHLHLHSITHSLAHVQYDPEDPRILAALVEMGFGNEDKNKTIMKARKGVVARVIDDLLQASDH
jgi:hypothetical protein